MTKSLRKGLLFGLLSFFLLSIPISDARAQDKTARISAGKLIVKFHERMETHLGVMRITTKSGIVQTGMSGFDRMALKHGAYAMKRMFPVNPQKEALHKKHGLHLWYEISIPATADPEQVSRDFKTLEEIAYSETVKAKVMIAPNEKAKIVAPPAHATINSPVNDPLFFLQWHYSNDGSSGGVKGADINLPEAWKVQTGSPNVIVSIHDLGVDITHQDLASNIWVNQAEKNGKTGVDDDYNGYVDDIYGYDFSGNSGTIPPGDHATHVAGTIAAINNNGIGVSGIAGGDLTHPGVKVMSAKILEGQFDNLAASYVYAADNGAVISQNSWGYTSPDVYDQAVLDAIDYFIDEAGNYPNSPMKGGIVIFAAGNSSFDGAWYPAYYNRVLSVSSLGRTNQRAYYSNFGAWVDIAAPGGDQSVAAEDGVLSTLPGNQYGFFQGTSMACPHVSGVAALIVSQNGGPNYRASDLWTALTTGTHDINSFNPDYVNQLGVGYLDAALALKTNHKIAPQRISDLRVTNGAQAYLDLAWTVSNDADDQTAASYEIIYGKDSLDVAKRKNIKSHVVVNTGNPGDTVTTSLINLLPGTRYFAAGYSIDRWGNRSPISAIVSGATTDGPSVSLDKSDITLHIAVDTAKTTSDNFTIANAADGELKWKSDIRQKNYSLDWNSVIYPKAPGKAPVSPKVGRHRTALRSKPVKASKLNYDNNYQTREISYAAYEYYGATMIGEEDLTIPNSAATKFTVAYADGFNLTSVSMLLNHNSDRGDAPAVIEIYKGDQLQVQNLVYAGQFNGYSNDNMVYDIQLDEQLFLPAGTVFWVAVHIPAGHQYPLGISAELEDGQANNCYISFDVGKTWTPLADALNSDGYVWVQIAESLSAPLDQYLTLNPSEGTVAAKDKSEVTVNADGSALINGTYNADLVVLNNDYSNNLATVPVTLSVSGQKPSLTSAAIVNFGGVFTGVSKEMTITIQNKGYGNFLVDNVTVNNSDFEILESPWEISALSSGAVKVKFNANSAGSHNGIVTLRDTRGNEYKLSIFATGIAPSQISLSPDTVSYTMWLGDKASGTFKIKNTGQYPLQYFMPKFAAGDSVATVRGSVNEFGYSYRTSSQAGSGLTYGWEDISATGKDVSEYFKDVAKTFYPVDLGFDFPIFNKTTSKLMLTRFGMLTLDDQVNVVGNLIDIGNPYMPYGFISALNQELSFNSGGSKLLYQAKAGKFIVQYENVSSAFNDDMRITFQIVVYNNGNVVINYKDISQLDAFTLSYIEVAIEDPEKKYGYLISNYENPLNASSQFSVEIVSPGSAILSNLSSTEGIIGLGEEAAVNFDVNSATLTEGKFWQNLTIVSNDPVNATKRFTVLLDVIGGGTGQITIDRDSIDLGSIFIGDSVRTVIPIHNTGTKSASLSQIVSSDIFTLTHDPLPDEIKPRTTTYLAALLKGTAPGEFSDVVNFTFSNGTQKSVYVHATVAEPPAIVVAYDSIHDVLNAGESALHAVTLTNTGVSDLQVVPSGNSWAYFQDLTAQTGTAGIQYPENTYYTTNNKKEGGPDYLWEEILSTGKRLDFLYDGITPEEKSVDLPFPFTFYGKDYRTVYINPKGIISFTKGQQVDFFTAATIPDPATPNNFITPYWANGAYYGLDGAPYGVFYKLSKDAVIFEFYNIYNIFSMGDPFHAQAILYSNGNIKMQYNLPGSFTATNFGVTGVENIDGSDGVRIQAYESFIQDKLAVLLAPANRMILAPGEVRNITLKVDAAELLDGTYSTNAMLQTNVPGKTSIALPVSAVIHGEALLDAPSSIDFGTLFITADGPASFTKDFIIQNEGSAPVDFSSIRMATGTEAALSMEVVDPWFGSYWSDVPPNFNPGDFTLTPRASQKLRITITPANENEILADTLIIESNSAQGMLRIPVKANLAPPPVMSVSQNKFVFVAEDKTYTSSGSFTIDNSQGQSDLNYSMSLSYQRGTSATTAKATQTTANKLGNPEKVMSQRKVTPGILSVEGYNRTLEYNEGDEPVNNIGFGYSAALTTATRFQADDKGFMLSHIQTSYASDQLAVNPIRVQVFAGNDMASAVLLTSQDYLFDEVGAGFSGTLTFALASPQAIYAYETFFVVIQYPFGSTHPQGISMLDAQLKDTFLYYNGSTWSDITMEPTFEDAAWIVKALEKTFVESTWLTLSDSIAGTVKAGASTEFNFDVFAKNLAANDALATLQIVSNAPNDSLENVSIDLHMNQAPQFSDMITDFQVDEMDTLLIHVAVKDLEQDAMTITIPDAPEGMTWIASDTSVLITYVPDYLSVREQTLHVTATDAGNRVNSEVVNIKVFNVNRSPVVVSNTDLSYSRGDAPQELPTESIVMDPDTDDTLSVTSTSSDPDVVTVLTSAEKIRLKPGKAGVSTVTITMTDNFGASATTSFTVTVNVVTGLEPAGNGNVILYPNPTNSTLNVMMDKPELNSKTIAILNSQGTLLQELVIDGMAPVIHLDVTDLPEGFYLLKLKSGRGQSTYKFIKK